MKRASAFGPLPKFKAHCRDVSARPEGGAAPALMLEYQKSHRRRAALGPADGIGVRGAEDQTPRRQGAGRGAGGANRRRRGAQAFGRRAYSRASLSDSRRLSERNERSECSELCRAAKSRAPQGTRSAAQGKPFEPRLRRARRLARTTAGMTELRTLASSRNGPLAAAVEQPRPTARDRDSSALSDRAPA